MWKPEWDALSARIAGLMEASTFLFRTVQAGENDSSSSTDIILVNCKETAQAILNLRRYKAALPVAAMDSLDRFDDWWTQTFVDT